MYKVKYVNAVLCFFIFGLCCTLLCAAESAEQSFLNKARKVKEEERQAVKNLSNKQAPQKEQAPGAEADYDASIESSTLSLIRTGGKDIAYVGEVPSSAAVSASSGQAKETNDNEDKPDATTSIP